MPTLVYRFDNVEAFPVLESQTTGRGLITTRVARCGDESVLRVTVKHDPRAAGFSPRERDPRAAGFSPRGHAKAEDPGEITATLALPIRAIDGDPRHLLLDVLGDAGGCRLFLEAGDAQGCGLIYSFGRVDFARRRTCSADVQQPVERWGSGGEGGPPRVAVPLHFYRLRIALDQSCKKVDVGFVALSVSGPVRLTAPGLA